MPAQLSHPTTYDGSSLGGLPLLDTSFDVWYLHVCFPCSSYASFLIREGDDGRYDGRLLLDVLLALVASLQALAVSYCPGVSPQQRVLPSPLAYRLQFPDSCRGYNDLPPLLPQRTLLTPRPPRQWAHDDLQEGVEARLSFGLGGPQSS